MPAAYIDTLMRRAQAAYVMARKWETLEDWNAWRDACEELHAALQSEVQSNDR